MLKPTCALAALMAVAATAQLSATTADAASAKPQGPCDYTSGLCVAFDFDDTIPVIDSYSFNMPAAGTAVVMFDGTMHCVVNSNAQNVNVVDLGTQIVPNAATVADYMGPGGNRYAMRLHHLTDVGTFGPSTTFNLAATRTFKYNAGGKKDVFYKINKLRMDSATACSILAASFTVLILP